MMRFSCSLFPTSTTTTSRLRGVVQAATKLGIERGTTNTRVFTVRTLETVAVQLDYYMSAQFAGVACAITNNLYQANGLDVHFLPICPVGLEMQRVRDHHANANNNHVTVGSVEQNIFTPLLHRDPSLKMKAVAAMFRRSPLCLASLKPVVENGESFGVSVGSHEDTVTLLQRILQSSRHGTGSTTVMTSPRATKLTDLMNGKFDAIQAYLTTEVPTLQRKLGHDKVFATPLEGMGGAKLGYSQMLFAPEEILTDDRREIVRSFLDATFRGWELAIRDTTGAVQSVREARATLGLNDEQNDHWDLSSPEYELEFVRLCCDFAKETFQGDKYGVINEKRWNKATEWLLDNNTESITSSSCFGFDSTIWQPSPQLLAGNELARQVLEEAKDSAAKFHATCGRKPSLAVITVGTLPRYQHGERRVELYSNKDNSWFNKTKVGEAQGFDIQEINLPQTATTDDLLVLLNNKLSCDNVDGIQLMWPLPDHVDSYKVYKAIPVEKDVDGAHYVGELELSNSSSSTTSSSSSTVSLPPVTPAAVVALLNEYDIELKNKQVLVIGRSRIVGSPLAHMLRDTAGAIVTMAHSQVTTDKLKQLVGMADVVISCAGSPGLLQAEWLKQQPVAQSADVISVGTTFDEDSDSLTPDFAGDLAAFSKRYTPVPGGVGPLSLPFLLRNVAFAAWRQHHHRETNSSVSDGGRKE